MRPREWALEIVSQLQHAGHSALWAGGCVRDALLGKSPKDYDVATSATPDQVQSIFGYKRTLAIGKSFGVITVIGPKSAGHIEVATFRRDGGYSDGRRPDSVEFTDAKEDALRRDFTINGMFFDPIAEKVIDYVGGEGDIEAKMIRAIGDPEKRIDEDKLRMLRGVRFAATYGFDIESKTMRAIQSRAGEIHAVSPERIGNELRRMLGHAGKSQALHLLLESKLWQQVLPECLSRIDFESKVQLLEAMWQSDFATAIAALLPSDTSNLAELQDQWRLTNEECERVNWILRNQSQLAKASTLPWSKLQPLLISPHAMAAIEILTALNAVEPSEERASSIQVCLAKLSLENAQLNPPALINGGTLKGLGITPGPKFKSLLNTVRAMQLDGELETAEAACEWVKAQIRD